jgi:serine/threonine protein kinase/Tfp pilus assembly protein PilF
MGGQHDKAARLFDAVVELASAAERAAYLDAACSQDAQLRAEVEELLAHDGAAGSFLEAPAHTLATAEEPLSERTGAAVGPYKLLEQIGEGGFGVVFLAEQHEPVRRKVALKVLKPGMDSKQVVTRFEAERQALALMDHPHIAKVLDAGTTVTGRPYFVMELVRGTPITDFCDQNGLGIRERLELFVSVCQAVQHAHQKGIIHRDLKPSNVLVTLHDGKAVPKVIDFGIAKATGQPLTDKTLFTNFAQMIGTPLYMSPEQAGMSGLDVDTRSDVYSLGVLLYELLTGTTPFEKSRFSQVGYDEMRRIIREEEPARPSTRLSTLGQAATTASANRQSDPKRLSQLFRGELDWIVMKAVEKDRTRRYETASGFARDIERYLADEPVEACPPSAGYRLKKFARKYKKSLTVSAAFALLLVLGVVASTWQAVRATHAEQNTSQALEQVTREQQKTQAALEQVKTALAAERTAKAHARRSLDTLTDGVVETMFARQPELGEPEKAFLRKVLASYEAITQEMGDTAEARFLRARGYYKVARLHALLGEQTKAKPEYRQAVILLEQLEADFRDVAEYRQALASSQNNLGNALVELGETAEAETAFRQAIALRKKLAHASPNVLPFRGELATNYHNLGSLLLRESKYPDAETAFRQALELSEKLATESPGYRPALARSRSLLAGVLREIARCAEAEKLYRQALEVQQKQVDEFPAMPGSRRDLADTYNGLGIALLRLGKLAEAETAFRKSLALRQRLADDFPQSFSYQRNLAAGHNDLGNALRLLRKYPEAETECRRSVDLKEKLVAKAGDQPRYREELARSYDNLGCVLAELRKPEAAETAFRQALDLRKKLADDSPKVAKYLLDLATTQSHLGNLFRLQGRPEQALPWHEQALDLLQPLHQQQPNVIATQDMLGRTHWGRAQVLEALKGSAEALADWDRAVELALPADRPRVQLGRARARVRAGKAAEAVADADALTRDPATPSPMLCSAADVCSLASTVAREATQREAYAGQALALLRRARAAGFFKDHAKVEYLKKDPDLKPLRQREDFQKFVAELEAAAKP